MVDNKNTTFSYKKVIFVAICLKSSNHSSESKKIAKRKETKGSVLSQMVN